MRLLAIAVVLCFATARGDAQSSDSQSADGQPAGSGAAFQGLFGPSTGDTQQPQTMAMDIDLLGAWDSNLAAGALGLSPDARVQIPGIYSSASGILQYQRLTPRSRVNASGGGFGRYIPGESLMDASGWATVGLHRSMTERTALQASATGSYVPYYGLTAFSTAPGAEPAGASLDSSVLWRPEVMYGAAADLDHQLNPRLSIQLQSSFNEREAANQSGLDYSAGGRATYRFTPEAGFHVGYTRQQLSNRVLTEHPILVEHQLDIGIDYSRTLSPDHPLAFGFSTASVLVSGMQPASPRRMRFSLLGNAFLSRALGRAWAAHVQYARSLQFLDITAQPFFVDTATAGIGGYLGPRVNLRGSLGYSSGSLTAGGQGFSTADALVSGQLALVRSLALTAEYLYDHYLFGSGVILPPGLDHRLDRQGVRLGLTWWIPFVR